MLSGVEPRHGQAMQRPQVSSGRAGTPPAPSQNRQPLHKPSNPFTNPPTPSQTRQPLHKPSNPFTNPPTPSQTLQPLHKTSNPFTNPPTPSVHDARRRCAVRGNQPQRRNACHCIQIRPNQSVEDHDRQVLAQVRASTLAANQLRVLPQGRFKCGHGLARQLAACAWVEEWKNAEGNIRL